MFGVLVAAEEDVIAVIAVIAVVVVVVVVRGRGRRRGASAAAAEAARVAVVVVVVVVDTAAAAIAPTLATSVLLQAVSVPHIGGLQSFRTSVAEISCLLGGFWEAAGSPS